jgi:alkaline phosphatase
MNMKKVSKKISVVLVLVLLMTSFGTLGVYCDEVKPIKNVIFLIPDGMSVTGTTLTRWMQGGQPLALDEMACGLVRTYWAKGAITDSAPGGTALSTATKTDNKYIAVSTKEDGQKPLATVLEAAKLNGKATGIISTSQVQHATPADFTAHYPDRSKEEILAEQQVYNNIDVVLGGGYRNLDGAVRKDKEDLIKEIKHLGYDYVTTPEALKASKADKLWGMFASMDLKYDMDRDPSKEPSLAEMTEKAIEVLSKDEDGFFLMVEGSKVDWAAHANDPVGVISDIAAFDKAVKVALDFAKENQETVVVSVTDHGNGGISIGDAGTTKGYDDAPLSLFIDPLKKVKLTGEGLEAKLNADRSNVKEVMAEYYGITDLTEQEIEDMKGAAAGRLNNATGPIISKRAHIGWTTGGHTGEDVVLYVYSPNGDRPTGVIDNTDVSKYIERILGVDLKAATEKLFVPAEKAFEAKGATVEIDTTGVDPILVIKKGSDVLKLAANKNIAELNRRVYRMDGVTVYNGTSFFVSQEAIDLIK